MRLFWPNWEYVQGSFTDDTTWTANWNTVDSYGLPYTGSLQIILDDDHQRVARFQANVTTYPDASVVQTITISGENLALESSDTWFARYETRGEATCTSILSLTDFRDWGTTNETLYNFLCQSSDYVSVYLTVDD